MEKLNLLAILKIRTVFGCIRKTRKTAFAAAKIQSLSRISFEQIDLKLSSAKLSLHDVVVDQRGSVVQFSQDKETLKEYIKVRTKNKPFPFVIVTDLTKDAQNPLGGSISPWRLKIPSRCSKPLRRNKIPHGGFKNPMEAQNLH